MDPDSAGMKPDSTKLSPFALPNATPRPAFMLNEASNVTLALPDIGTMKSKRSIKFRNSAGYIQEETSLCQKQAMVLRGQIGEQTQC